MRLGTLAGVRLVAEREIGSKIRSKTFVVSFAILVIAALGLVVWGGFTAARAAAEQTTVAVTADAVDAVRGIDDVETTEVADRSAAEELVASGDVDAAVVGDPSSPAGVTIIAESETPDALVLALSQVPTVELLAPSDANPFGLVVALGLGILFMLSAQLFGATIAQSVVEEKQTRIVELLISAVPARVLLAGKVVGNTVLAMGQIVVLGLIAVVGLAVTGQSALLAGVGAPLVSFAVFFLFGFVLLASLFAGAAAMVSRQEDVGSTTTPIMLLVLTPYFLVIFFWNNPVVLAVMSYVPFSAPVGMPMRLFLGEVAWWEPVVSLAILLATCAVAIAVGARIYENSLLRMGGRVTLREALRS